MNQGQNSNSSPSDPDVRALCHTSSHPQWVSRKACSTRRKAHPWRCSALMLTSRSQFFVPDLGPASERTPIQSVPLVPHPPVLWSGIPSFSLATPLPCPGSPSPLPKPPLSKGRAASGDAEEGEDRGRRKGRQATLPCHLPCPHPTPFLQGHSLGTS